jgi:2-amino-4-hydroxy-6-hydroxymethyldihydropteridine diphosphokinase
MLNSTEHLYLIGLGSNQHNRSLGAPAEILNHAIAALEMHDTNVFSHSHIIRSRPIGPSKREFANAAAIIASPLSPDKLLQRLKEVEAHFGRKYRGQRWQSRSLDLDIILWSGGIWIGSSPALAIPHPQMQLRRFVLQPACEIAPNWRDPLSGHTLKQLLYRQKRPKRLDA